MSYTFNSDYDIASTDERIEPNTFINGFPQMSGNLHGEGAPFDTVALSMALENARTLQYAITGDETSGVLSSSTAHNHTTNLNTAMPWMQIGAWNLHTRLFADGSNPNRLGFVSGSTSFQDVLMVPFAVPTGHSNFVPEFWVYVSNSNTITIGFDFYATSDLTTAIASGEVSYGTATYDGPVVTDELGYDLSSLAGAIGYLKVKVKVSASTAVLHHVKLRLPFRTAVSPSTRTDLDTTQFTGGVTPTAAKLKKIYSDNITYLRQQTFGTTLELPSRSYAHDHGEHRGKLLERNQHSLSFGPMYFSGDGSSSGGTIGIPFADAASDDYSATTPKLIAHNIIHLQGQVINLRCEAGFYLSGASAPRSVDIAVSLRPIDQTYKTYTSGDQIYTTSTISKASDGFVRAAINLGALDSLGTLGEDRVFELCVWQTSTIASTETYRLCGLCLYNSGNAAQDQINEDLTQPKSESISLARFKSGLELSNLLTAQFNRVSNQVCREILGGVQGFKRDGSEYNTSKPWYRRVKEVHQHRGSYTDIEGVMVDDGAVIRLPLCAQSFIAVISSQGETTTAATTNASLGVRLHPTGTPSGAEWVRFDQWVTIPQGLGAIDLYAAIQPATQDPRSRLFVSVSVLPESSTTTICTSVRCGDYESSDNTTIKGATVDELTCEVLPVDSPLFATNKQRLRKGLGCWTTDALREATRTTDLLRTNCYRVTMPIRIAITPTFTGPYKLRTRWALQTGDYTAPTGGTYDSAARMLSLLAVPSRGY